LNFYCYPEGRKGMEAETRFPRCILHLVVGDIAPTELQKAIDALWPLRSETVLVRRHAQKSWNADTRLWARESEVGSQENPIPHIWVFALGSAGSTTRESSTIADHACWFENPWAGLFLLPLSDSVNDWQVPEGGVFDAMCAPWASGEMRFRLRALLARLLRQQGAKAEAQGAFYRAGSNCARLPLKNIKADAVAAFERGYLISLLHMCQGNVSVAARMARKHRRAFLALLRKHGIDAKGYRSTAQELQADSTNPSEAMLTALATTIQPIPDGSL
jgi:hypothetical protein